MSTISHYFIPTTREGLATRIRSAADGHRAMLDVALTASARKKGSTTRDSATVNQQVALYGPGDVLGFHSRIVHRTDPKPDVGDFEPNYFPAIEFADFDFAWRFTADQATEDGSGRLQPWITLIVLVSESRGETIRPEFAEGTRTNRSLPRNILVDPNALPDLSQAWRWAHVHVTAEKGLQEVQLLELVRREPERAAGRLLCPRRLQPGVRYTAFVVPTFKLGVMAGLGCALGGEVNALVPAWGDGSAGGERECLFASNEGWVRLPYYYRWEFRTGMRGDFEHLVRLLEARELTNLGLRDIDCEKPGFGISGVVHPGLDVPQKHYLGMEGALKSLDTCYTRWGRDLGVAIKDADGIKAVGVHYVGAARVQVSWQTVQRATGRVDYGPTTDYGNVCTDPARNTTHSFLLTDLVAGTTYHLQVVSQLDDGTEVRTEDASFEMPPPYALQGELAALLNKPNTEDRESRVDLAVNIQVPAGFVAEPKGKVLGMGDQAQFTWQTNEARKSRIEYARIDKPDRTRTVQNTELTVDHELILERLIPGKAYKFKIITENAAGDVLETPDGRFTMAPLPVVVPPVYGRWHYGKLRDDQSLVDPTDQQGWLGALNLDPRHRAAAGLGAEVVRRNQEPLMASAWDQLGAIESANDLLRRLQLGRDSSTFIHKRLTELSPDTFMRVTAAVQKHVTIQSPQTNARVSVAAYLSKQTRITVALLDPAFSRIAGPRRVLAKRQKRVHPQAELRKSMYQNLAEGRLEAAGPTRRPLGPASITEISQRLLAEIPVSGPGPVPVPGPTPGPIPVPRRLLPGDPILSRPGLRFNDRHINAAKLNEVLLTHPFRNIRGISAEEVNRTANAARETMARWLDRQPKEAKPAVQNAGFVAGVKDQVVKQILPTSTFVDRAQKRLRHGGPFADRFADGAKGDPLDPIMWAPEFDHPMYEPLRDIAHEAILPGVERIPQNTVGLLTPNRRFLESYLCGCNHELAGELLWRGYPTDQRGSYFRQFWDVSEYVVREDERRGLLRRWLGSRELGTMPFVDKFRELVRRPERTTDALMGMWLESAMASTVEELNPEQQAILRALDEENMQVLRQLSEEDLNGLTEHVVIAEQLAEKLHDVDRLHQWGDKPLGTNKTVLQDSLVLVIRGDLLRRYPNALIYAAEVAKNSRDETVPALSEYDPVGGAKPGIFPVFRADLPPDLTFFGFPFSAIEARDTKYIVIEQAPSEPRFGADEAVDLRTVTEPLGDWDNLSWSHLGFGTSELDAHYGLYIDTPPDAGLSMITRLLRNEWTKASSARRAGITFQKPVRISIAASRMLPKDK